MNTCVVSTNKMKSFDGTCLYFFKHFSMLFSVFSQCNTISLEARMLRRLPSLSAMKSLARLK